MEGKGGTSVMMTDVYLANGGSVLGVEDVLPSETGSYGIVNAKERVKILSFYFEFI